MGSPEDTDVVLALLAATNEGRIDDILALLHADLIWEPLNPEMRPVYIGRHGTEALTIDLRRIHGPYRLDHEPLTRNADGSIQLAGTVVRLTGGVEVPARRFAAKLVVEDGKVQRFDVLEVEDLLPSEEPTETAADRRKPTD